jgi:hypothetical protein
LRKVKGKSSPLIDSAITDIDRTADLSAQRAIDFDPIRNRERAVRNTDSVHCSVRRR